MFLPFGFSGGVISCRLRVITVETTTPLSQVLIRFSYDARLSREIKKSNNVMDLFRDFNKRQFSTYVQRNVSMQLANVIVKWTKRTFATGRGRFDRTSYNS